MLTYVAGIVTYANVCCRYSGDKNIITFGGDHNSPRPAFFFVSLLLRVCGLCVCVCICHVYMIYILYVIYICVCAGFSGYLFSQRAD
jgi:hypothetical protein